VGDGLELSLDLEEGDSMKKMRLWIIRSKWLVAVLFALFGLLLVTSVVLAVEEFSTVTGSVSIDMAPVPPPSNNTVVFDGVAVMGGTTDCRINAGAMDIAVAMVGALPNDECTYRVTVTADANSLDVCVGAITLDNTALFGLATLGAQPQLGDSISPGQTKTVDFTVVIDAGASLGAQVTGAPLHIDFQPCP